METSNHASQIRPSGPGRFILHELRLPLNTALLRTLSQESSTTVIHSLIWAQARRVQQVGGTFQSFDME